MILHIKGIFVKFRYIVSSKDLRSRLASWSFVTQCHRAMSGPMYVASLAAEWLPCIIRSLNSSTTVDVLYIQVKRDMIL